VSKFGWGSARWRAKAPIRRRSSWVVAAVLAAGCGGANGTNVIGASTSIPPTETVTLAPTPTPSPTPTADATADATADPGLLPQTHVLPNTADPTFRAGTQSLWQAIVEDNPAVAAPFFFPRTAYVQVKAIQNPVSDYQNRLIGLYRLDIHAAHALLGPDSAGAQLVGVEVPTKQAVWIVPGVEYNKGSYYRVFGTRITYRVGGKTKSFGIFSMISWRGQWYVVHLGPSTRSTGVGVVYQPKG
jgi:hypothetical protein